MSVIRKLIAPACAAAALSISTSAFAGEDPAPEPTIVAEAGEPSAGEQVEATEPVTLENEVAAGEASLNFPISHGGRISLGAIRTIAGLNGITFRYRITDNFHLGLNLGAATFSFRYPDLIDDPVDCGMNPRDGACTKKTRTVAYIGSSLEFIYWVIGKPAGNLPFQADFGVGGRLGFQHLVNSTDVPNNLDDPLQFTAEIPLMLQLNIGENFAIVPEFGAVFRWNPGTRLAGDPTAMPPEPPDSNPGFDDPNGQLDPIDTSGPGFGFEITDHVGLFGGASLLYTF
ncbi:MAG TPA: hypothetical protein VK034_18310 [Enhygromyxa sp.]|nr:hypothetical protein [Enhygromyxa sp.]